MNIEELVGSIESIGVPVIKVAEFDEDDASSMVFDGTLDEYIESLNKFDAKVVFINSSSLTEDMFTCEIENHYEGVGAFPEEIDLTSVSPELKAYKKYEGSDAHYHLLAISQLGKLVFHFQEEWWGDLLELLVLVGEKLEAGFLEKHESQIQKRENDEKNLLKTINSLKSDNTFIACRTLKVKAAYALEKHPELNDLPKPTLKSAIADIDAIIEAMMFSQD